MENEDNKEESDDSTEATPAASRLSLRAKSEHIHVNKKSSMTLPKSQSHPESPGEAADYEGASTSKDAKPEVTTIFPTPDIFEINSQSSLPFEGRTKPEGKKPSTIILIPIESSVTLIDEEESLDMSTECEFEITPPPYTPLVLYSAPPLHGAPPTYSAIMRIGPVEIYTRRSMRIFGRRPEVRIQPSPPFIAPAPPPSYAEVHGLCVNHTRPIYPQITDGEDSMWGPEPMSVICPVCNTFVITQVRNRRSNLTHFSALALCICGCWPCCLLPYCLKGCKTTYHECPVCLSVIGMYNPCVQRFEPRRCPV